ncbi:unnamed protein product [Moneuplotes crassus]|uniref:Smr domain-containing protein n=1 Tax=Euplotes crassus TaxID=5936 RepID=A0AAD1XAK4_EUPCR|nr:unnamed protein product [Moneuplotes crassus]
MEESRQMFQISPEEAIKELRKIQLNSLGAQFPQCDQEFVQGMFKLCEYDFESTKLLLEEQVQETEAHPAPKVEKERTVLEEEKEEETIESLMANPEAKKLLIAQKQSETKFEVKDNKSHASEEDHEEIERIQEDLVEFYCTSFPNVPKQRIECIVLVMYPDFDQIEKSLEISNEKYEKIVAKGPSPIPQPKNLLEDKFQSYLKIRDANSLPQVRPICANEIVNKRKRDKKLQRKHKKTNHRTFPRNKPLNNTEKDQLFSCLKEFRTVLDPQISKIQCHILTCQKSKDLAGQAYWETELGKLRKYYEMYKKQSIDIKMEANNSKEEGHVLDLHVMTVDEAVDALKDKIEECVALVNSQKLVNGEGRLILKVITGRGKHSKGKPVIKIRTHKYLKDKGIQFVVAKDGGSLDAIIE